MPIYCFACDDCGQRAEALRPMRDAARPGPRCRGCRRRMRRDLAGERPAIQAFTPYEACSGGCLPHELEHAERRGNDYFKRGPDGTLRRLNPPGFRINPKTGDVLIESAAAKARYLATIDPSGPLHDNRDDPVYRDKQRHKREWLAQCETQRKRQAARSKEVHHAALSSRRKTKLAEASA